MRHFLNAAAKKSVFFFMAVLLSWVAGAQTNPSAFALSGGNFSFTTQTATSTTYPANMQGWTTGTNNIASLPTAAPGADQALVASGGANTSGLSNLGANGFNFLSTSSAPNQQVGEICVALNSTGRINILVGWLAADQTSGSTRQMNITLQYRTSTSGAFTTVAGTTYTTSNTSQASAQTFSNIALPAACENQAVLQLRWVTYESAAQSGGRDAIRLDEISVASSSSSVVANPASFSATAFSTSQINLSATANGNGNNIAVSYNLTGTFSAPTDGVAPPSIGNAFAGGTIIYSGAAGSLTNHTSLISNTQYFYKAFSYDGSNNYSPGITANATTQTLSPPTSANASAITATTFNANWTTVAGASGGYLLDVSSFATFSSAGTVASDDFENALALFSASSGTGTFYTGSSTSGERPASTTFVSSGTYAFGKSNGTVAITSSNIDNSANSSTQLSFRLSSFSVNSNGNGADAGDLVTVEISPDGGTNYYSTVRVLGNNNACWSYLGGTASASAAYDGDASPADFTPAGGGERTTDGYSTVTVTNLPAVTNLKIRITLLNDNANERWLIDDLKITGNVGSFVTGYNAKPISGQATTTSNVTGLTTGTYYYRVRATDGTNSSTNSSTITVTINNPATADFRTKAAGTFSTVGTWEYNSGFSGVNVYADATATPTSSSNIDVRHKLLLDQDFTVANGKTFTLNSSLTTADTFRVDATSRFTVAGTANFNSKPVTFLSTINGTGILGQVTGTVSNATNVTAEQYIPSKRAWRFMSGKILSGSQTINSAWQEGQTITNAGNVLNNKPGFGTHITGGTSANGFDQTQSNAYSIRTWTPAQASGWSVTPPATATTALNSQNGYALFVRGSRGVDLTTNTSTDITILRATGTLNTGAATQSFTGIATGDFLLAGNPYISPVNFTSLAATSLENRIWLWDPKLGTVGGYVLMDAGTNTRTGATGGSYAGFSTTIASGLAFFVRSTGTSASLGYAETAKTTAGVNVYRQQPLPRVYVYLQQLVGQDSVTNLDGIAAVFGRNYRKAVTTEDAAKLNNFTENIAFRRNGMNLALEAHPLLTTTDTLFVNIYYTKAQQYQFTISPENVPEFNGVSAVLEDLFLNTVIPLAIDQPTTVPFAVTTDTNSFGSGRFRIILNRAPANAATENITGILPETAASISVYPNPVTAGTLGISMNKMPAGRYEMTLYNNNAHVVWSGIVSHEGGSIAYRLPVNKDIGNGVYTLSARDKRGVVKTTSVIFAGK